jgi:MFS family permease
VYLQRQRGLALTQVALIDALFWVVAAFAELPTGAVADRFGRKASLVCGALLSCVGLLVYGLAPSFALLVLGSIMWAIALTFFSGADEALLYESLCEEGREDAYTKVTGRARAVRRAVMMVGSISGGLLASVWLGLPFVVAAVSQAVGLAVVVAMREPKTAQSHSRATTSYGKIVRESLTALREHPPLRFAVAYAAVLPIPWFLAGVLLLQPFAVSLGVPVALIGVLVLSVNGARMLGSLLAEQAARLGIRKVLVGAPMVLVACLVAIGLSRSLVSLVPIAVLCITTAAAEPMATGIIQRQLTDNVRATILSMQSLLFTLVLAGVEPAVAYVADTRALQPAYFVLAGALGLFFALALAWGWRWTRPEYGRSRA